MSLLLKYNTFYLLAEITLKLGLQSTEEYFPYIAYAFFVFFIMQEGVFYLKFMLLILKLRSLFFLVFVGDHGKLFLKISQMQVVCICYCYNFHIFLREKRVE